MTKIAASVSMEVGMAHELKDEAAARGQSFSARVVELIESGRAREHGLFSSTGTRTIIGPDGGQMLPDGTRPWLDSEPPEQSDDGSDLHSDPVKSPGSSALGRDSVSAQSSSPADGQDVIRSRDEDARDGPLSDRMSSASQHEPADRRQPGSVRRLRSPEPDTWPTRDELDQLDYEDRVIACINDEPRSAEEIAEFLSMPIAPVTSALDTALEDGTIHGRRVAGAWRFWGDT